MKWIFTGGDDGFIRKYDFVTSMNGEQSLTLNQRHGLVDSIQKASFDWNRHSARLSFLCIHAKATAPPTAVTNEAGSESVVPPAPPDTKAPKFSPVFSLAVQSEGVWALAGAESGSVSLYTVRHDEGTLWDLETGAVARDLGVLTSQIASLALQPTSAAENSNILLTGTIDGRMSLVDSRVEAPVVGVIVPMGVPWWMQSAVWGADGTKVYCGRRNGSGVVFLKSCFFPSNLTNAGIPVDEFDMIAGRLLQNIKMPKDSGPVYSVAAMANARSLVVGSYDNIRLWDLHFEQLMMEAGANNEEDSLGLGMGSGGVGVTGTAGAAASVVPSPLVPFSIVPGHHGGAISNLSLVMGHTLSRLPHVSSFLVRT
ncbi:hypothetical protein DFJ73DRAFT_756726 [Zopfochytrium polystomum]|nr:hypothetical protein DFJ73DRAFT_756726 [Zopfochytrium polystomum]